MSETAQQLVVTLRKGVQTCEELADDLAFMAKVGDHAPAAATLYNLARMQRVKALQLQGQIAALRVQYGMV